MTNITSLRALSDLPQVIEQRGFGWEIQLGGIMQDQHRQCITQIANRNAGWFIKNGVF